MTRWTDLRVAPEPGPNPSCEMRYARHRRGTVRRRSRLGLIWILTSSLIFGMAAAWSLSSPIPSGPDEPAQFIKAAAVAHGTLTGEHQPGTLTIIGAVRVPQLVASTTETSSGCFYGKPSVSASCLTTASTSQQLVDATTYLSLYPPTYYAIVGLGSLIPGQIGSLEIMRLVGALVGALFLGWALATALTSELRWLGLGVAIALTPLAIYLISVVNSSGLEASTAIATWTAFAAMVLSPSQRPRPAHIWGFAISAVFLAQIRPLSPVFILCIITAVAVIRPRRTLEVLRYRPVLIACGAVGVGVVSALAFSLTHGTFSQGRLPPPHGSDGQILASIFGTLPTFARQSIGSFGSPDTASPVVAVGIWLLAAGLVTGLAIVTGRRWEALALGLVIISAFVLLPVLADYSHARSNGYIWQGRYQFPLTAGVPILASAILGARTVHPAGVVRRFGNPAAILVCGALAAGHLASWYWVLRRYMVGTRGAVNPFTAGANRWHPASSFLLIAPLVVLTTVGLMALVGLLSTEPGPHRKADGHGDGAAIGRDDQQTSLVCSPAP